MYQHQHQQQQQQQQLNLGSSNGSIGGHCSSPTDSSNSATSNTGVAPNKYHHQQQQQQQQQLHSANLTSLNGGHYHTNQHQSNNQSDCNESNGSPIEDFGPNYTNAPAHQQQSPANGPSNQQILQHNGNTVGACGTLLVQTGAGQQHQSLNQLHPSHQHHNHQQQHLQYGLHHASIDSTTMSSTLSNSKKSVDKGSDEYKKRRERNNVAVRKSREKAKLRSRETERRVAELSKENQLYRAQYEELRREFNVLKSLLLKTGLTEQVIEDEAQRHSMQQQISQVSNSVHMVAAAAAAGNHHHHHHHAHHIVSSLNNHVQTLKGVTCGSMSGGGAGGGGVGVQHYGGGGAGSVDTVDQWSDGINAYVEEWAS